MEFDRTGVSFEHLRGPFAACQERFELVPAAHGSVLVHTGTFSVRGGSWTWPFGLLVVRPVFERHVLEHVEQLREELGRGS